MESIRNLTHKLPNNVGKIERIASLAAGGALTLYGLKRRSFWGGTMAMAGSELLYRGITGHCPVYGALGISTADTGRRQLAGVPYGEGVKTEEVTLINRSPEELYQFWRNFENLPPLMPYLETVKNLPENRSHWIVKGPAGVTLEWDSEVTTDIENSRIDWQSRPGSDIQQAGSIRFEALPGDRGTKVTLTIHYIPPGGAVGKAVTRLTHGDPLFQVQESLRRFKQFMETGEIATTEGQPSGRAED